MSYLKQTMWHVDAGRACTNNGHEIIEYTEIRADGKTTEVPTVRCVICHIDYKLKWTDIDGPFLEVVETIEGEGII